MKFRTVDNIEGIDKLINNYKNICGKRTIILDVPLNSLKCIARILSNFKSEVLFLRSEEKDIEYIVKLKYYYEALKGGTVFKGYKRASQYIPIIEEAIKLLTN